MSIATPIKLSLTVYWHNGVLYGSYAIYASVFSSILASTKLSITYMSLAIVSGGPDVKQKFLSQPIINVYAAFCRVGKQRKIYK